MARTFMWGLKAFAEHLVLSEELRIEINESLNVVERLMINEEDQVAYAENSKVNS